MIASAAAGLLLVGAAYMYTKKGDSKAVEVSGSREKKMHAGSKYKDELIATAKKIGAGGKGILAADESTGTIGKRFAGIKVDNNEANRIAYRELLFTTPDLEKYISGSLCTMRPLKEKRRTVLPSSKS
jgi:hypothetical protein